MDILDGAKYKEILSIWNCYVCKKTPERPIQISTCRHTFCYNCVSRIHNCPKCGAQYIKKDLKFFPLLTDYTTLSKKIEQIFQHTEDKSNIQEDSKIDSMEKDINLEKDNDTKEQNKENNMEDKLRPMGKKEITVTSVDEENSKETKVGGNSKTNTIVTLNLKVTDLARFYTRYYNPDAQSPKPSGNTEKSDLHMKKQSSVTRKVFWTEVTPRISSSDMNHLRKKQKTIQKKSAELKNKQKSEKEKRNYKGETTLHTACVKEDLQMVTSLLESGSNPNVKDNAGSTPLIEAVTVNNLPLVEVLLKHGALVNTPGFLNTTALLEAVYRKNIPIIELLIKYGADIHIRSQLNNSPLSLAKEDDATIYDLLLKCKPDLSLVKESKPSFNPNNIPTVCCDISKVDVIEKVIKICEKFNFEVQFDFWSEASHIVTLTDDDLNCECSYTILKGILNGLSIVSFKWLLECDKEKAVIPVEGYEVVGTKHYPNTGVPGTSRLNAFRMNPKLFDGCHISLTGAWQDCVGADFPKSLIISLVRDSGAVYLFRDPDPEEIPEKEVTIMFHSKVSSPMAHVSHVLLYQPNSDPKKEPLLKYNMKHVKTLPTTWFLKCIQTFSICDP